jgi:hypothetical protein
MAKMSSLNSHPNKLEVEGDRTEQSTQAFAAELISCSCSSTFYRLSQTRVHKGMSAFVLKKRYECFYQLHYQLLIQDKTRQAVATSRPRGLPALLTFSKRKIEARTKELSNSFEHQQHVNLS